MTPQDGHAFTIIIAARNAEKFILETLEHLLLSDNQSFQVLVINDGSTDGTANIVSAFCARNPGLDLALLVGEAKGVSAARNLGLARTTTPFVLFLDADDLLAPDALDCFINTLQGSSAVAALGRVLRMSETGDPMPSPDNRDLVPNRDQLQALIKKNYIINGGALAIRAAIAKEVGGYDETLKYGEDWEFWCRILNAGDLDVLDNTHVLTYRQISTGANVTAASKPFARKIACLERVANNAEIRRKIGWRLWVALRMRRVDIFWSNVRTTYQYGNRRAALLLGTAGLFVYPDSFARPKLALRLLKSVRR